MDREREYTKSAIHTKNKQKTDGQRWTEKENIQRVQYTQK